MDRKRFIKTSGLGLSLIFIPGVIKSQENSKNKDNQLQSTPKFVKDDEGVIFNVIGDIQTHKLIGSDTANQLVEWVDNVMPGTGIPPHIHTLEDEIFRVIAGQVEIMVAGETKILNAGDMALAPKNVPHAWTVVGTEKAKMITTAFPAGIEIMFRELAKLPAGPPDFKKVTEICESYGIRFV